MKPQELTLLASKTISGSEALLLPIFSDNLKDFSPLPSECFPGLEREMAREKFTGKAGTVLSVAVPHEGKLARFYLLGVGASDSKDLLANFRKAIAAGTRAATAFKLSALAFKLPTGTALSESELAREILTVAALAPYKCLEFKSKDQSKDAPEDEPVLVRELKVLADHSPEIESVFVRVQASYQGISLARRLVMLPPNIANPALLAQTAREIAQEGGFECKILDKAECEKLKMGAFLGVAQGSINEPYFIHLHYKPAGEVKKHVALVGKGITFDSGGLSLKPAKSMEKMKYDMAGSAAVLGTMKALAALKPAGTAVTMIVAACENMPSGAAYRPGDILTAMNGKTMEINNTDAEGRVTLADAVYYASLQNPDEIIDIATLTGAVVVALGETAAGLMTNDQPFADRVKASFEGVGEKLWQLPLYEEYEEDVVKGTVADMINASSGGQAGSQNGALFIKQFINGKAWVHLDIAGTCWPEKRDTPYTPKNNPAGFGVLGFLNYLLHG